MDYNSFASIYDLTCPGVEGDVQFFLEKSKEARGGVLEVGCGTGRIYLELLKAGIKAEGIDSSKAMLSILKKKASKLNLSTKVSVQSVIDYAPDSQFGLIFLPYRTFMHLYNKEDQLNALQNLKRALLPNGKIIIDLFNPDMERIKKGSSYILLEDTPEYLVWLWEEFDQEKQIVNNLFRLEKKNKDDQIVETTVKEFRARWFYPEEFRKLLQSVGLTVEHIFADYHERPFTGNEDKMIWVLGK